LDILGAARGCLCCGNSAGEKFALAVDHDLGATVGANEEAGRLSLRALCAAGARDCGAEGSHFADELPELCERRLATETVAADLGQHLRERSGGECDSGCNRCETNKHETYLYLQKTSISRSAERVFSI